jgi:hypothetical protein
MNSYFFIYHVIVYKNKIGKKLAIIARFKFIFQLREILDTGRWMLDNEG